jgi:hypothetical protein
MRKSTWLQLMDGLSGIEASEEALSQFEQLIRTTAAMDGISDLDAAPAARVKFARHLLDMRESRTVICQRMMTKYSIGRSQAYDAISQALKLSGFP